MQRPIIIQDILKSAFAQASAFCRWTRQVLEDGHEATLPPNRPNRALLDTLAFLDGVARKEEIVDLPHSLDPLDTFMARLFAQTSSTKDLEHAFQRLILTVIRVEPPQIKTALILKGLSHVRKSPEAAFDFFDFAVEFAQHQCQDVKAGERTLEGSDELICAVTEPALSDARFITPALVDLCAAFMTVPEHPFPDPLPLGATNKQADHFRRERKVAIAHVDALENIWVFASGTIRRATESCKNATSLHGPSDLFSATSIKHLKAAVPFVHLSVYTELRRSIEVIMDLQTKPEAPVSVTRSSLRRQSWFAKPDRQP